MRLPLTILLALAGCQDRHEAPVVDVSGRNGMSIGVQVPGDQQGDVRSALLRIGVDAQDGLSAEESVLVRNEVLAVVGRRSLSASSRTTQPYDHDPAYHRALLETFEEALDDREASSAGEGIFESRVFNGVSTDHPRASVALYASQNRFVCSGTVIGPRRVLTAAHCFCGGAVPTEVRLDTNASVGSSRVRINRHRCYAPCDQRAAKGDVAIVDSADDLNVDPLSLATKSDFANLRSGADITFVGFGETGSSSAKGTRRMQDTKVLHSKCEGSYLGSDGVSRLIKDTYKCAGPHELVSLPPFDASSPGGLGDVCRGDSGGTVLLGKMFDPKIPRVGPLPPRSGQVAVIVAQVVPAGKPVSDVCGGYGSVAVRLDPEIVRWIGNESEAASCIR